MRHIATATGLLSLASLLAPVASAYAQSGTTSPNVAPPRPIA